jgi:signal transduction histidine kinase
MELQHLLKEAQAELGAAIEDLRELARGINAAVLTDRGLAPAVHTLANRSPVPVEVRSLAAQRLAAEVETTAYYVISEALLNAAKHSQAGSVLVCVDATPGQLRIEVTDDGIGGATVSPDGGLGGLVDRVEAVHGHLALNSPIGKGTQLVVELPCGSS